jgi:hypothetical protein
LQALCTSQLDDTTLGTKVSVICDDDQDPLACLFDGANVLDARTTLEMLKMLFVPFG